MGAPAQEEPRASAQVRILNEKFGGALPADDVEHSIFFPGQGRLNHTCQPAAAARHSRPTTARARPAYCTTPGCTCGHGWAPPTASRPRARAGGGPWRSVEQTPLFTSSCASHDDASRAPCWKVFSRSPPLFASVACARPSSSWGWPSLSRTLTPRYRGQRYVRAGQRRMASAMPPSAALTRRGIKGWWTMKSARRCSPRRSATRCGAGPGRWCW